MNCPSTGGDVILLLSSSPRQGPMRGSHNNQMPDSEDKGTLLAEPLGGNSPINDPTPSVTAYTSTDLQKRVDSLSRVHPWTPGDSFPMLLGEWRG
jgi:hypothetical protein